MNDTERRDRLELAQNYLQASRRASSLAGAHAYDGKALLDIFLRSRRIQDARSAVSLINGSALFFERAAADARAAGELLKSIDDVVADPGRQPDAR